MYNRVYVHVYIAQMEICCWKFSRCARSPASGWKTKRKRTHLSCPRMQLRSTVFTSWMLLLQMHGWRNWVSRRWAKRATWRRSQHTHARIPTYLIRLVYIPSLTGELPTQSTKLSWLVWTHLTIYMERLLRQAGSPHTMPPQTCYWTTVGPGEFRRVELAGFYFLSYTPLI